MRGNGMTNLAPKRTVFSFVAMASSATTMLWLAWRFPITTAAATLAVLAAFELSARVSQLIEAEARSLEQRAN
jgi:hypothetical protein